MRRCANMNEEDSKHILWCAQHEDTWEAPDGEMLGRKAVRRFDKVRDTWVVHLSIDATKYTFVEANEMVRHETWLCWVCACYDHCQCIVLKSNMEWSRGGKKYKIEIW